MAPTILDYTTLGHDKSNERLGNKTTTVSGLALDTTEVMSERRVYLFNSCKLNIYSHSGETQTKHSECR